MPTGLSAGNERLRLWNLPVQLNACCGGLACGAGSPTAAAGIGPLGWVMALVVSRDGTGVSTSSAPELAAHPEEGSGRRRRIAGTADGRIRTCTQNKGSTVIHVDGSRLYELLTETC
ncbi:hypothetical protein ACOJBO_33710 [Rhizobium beringeri]